MIPCFLVTETNRFKRYLRRYDGSLHSTTASTPECPGPYKYHNADGPFIGEVIVPFDPASHSWKLYSSTEPVSHTDPRWPVKCDHCEYRFTPHDEWQVYCEHIFLDGTGGEHNLRERTPGMMWFVPWYFDPTDPEDMANIANRTGFLSPHYLKDWAAKRPPISVICPSGSEWCVDQMSSNGDGWTVTGEAPLLSCSPSIVVPGYHGYLGSNGAPPGYFSEAL